MTKAPVPFKKLIRLQLVIASLSSLLLSLFLVSLVLYIYLSFSFQHQVKVIQKDAENEIIKHLATGWTKPNINRIYSHLITDHQDYLFALIKAPNRETEARKNIPPSLRAILRKTEVKSENIAQIELMKGEIQGGIPIIFEAKCLACHQGTAQLGEYAGTLVFKSNLTSYKMPITASFGFLAIFVFTFLGLSLFLLGRITENDLIKPLKLIHERITLINIDEKIDWNRSPQRTLEVDLIDSAIHQSVIDLKRMYDKLDTIRVTEHESGFFHQDHFKNALQFEIYRAKRYERLFSVITVKLKKIIDENPEANRTRAEKIALFSNFINKEIRNSDIPFRIGEELFVILAPETDEKGIVVFAKALNKRFSAANKMALETKIHFEISTGYSTYLEDSLDPKELTHIALKRMSCEENQGELN